MAKVDIYTKPNCPFCVRAKKLLQNEGYTEVNEMIVGSQASKEDIEERLQSIGNETPVRTVPQIFMDNEYIGGFTELEKRLNGSQR